MTVEDGRGRPAANYVDEAIDIILTSDEPISTSKLKDRLNLKPNKMLILRRGLRRAQERGVIREVALHKDGSLCWIGGERSLAQCAAHAANIFLDRESPGRRIDTEKFEKWLLNIEPVQN
jgi:hypothetical protein